MNEVDIKLIFDKAEEPKGCDHMTTFMHYVAGDAAVSYTHLTLPTIYSV